MERCCTRCFRQKPSEEFPWRNQALKSVMQFVYKECYAERSAQWYEDNKDRQLETVRRNNQNYREVARAYIRDYRQKILVRFVGSPIPVCWSFITSGETKKLKSHA